jgi:hypothetical protein
VFFGVKKELLKMTYIKKPGLLYYTYIIHCPWGEQRIQEVFNFWRNYGGFLAFFTG